MATDFDVELRSALDNGQREIARRLVAGLIGKPYSATKDIAAIHAAIELRRWDILELLLKAGEDPDALYNNCTPLVRATRLSEVDAVKLLIQYGADIEFAEKNAKTPLFLAVEYGEPDIVDYLLEAGANPAAVDEWKRSPLFHALSDMRCRPNTDRANYERIIGSLATAYPLAEFARTRTGQEAIRHAVYYGDAELIKLLIDSGLDVNSNDLPNHPIIYSAIEAGNAATFFALVQGGGIIDPNAVHDPDAPSATVFAMACQCGSEEIVDYLIQQGADVNHGLNSDGHSMPLLAAISNCRLPIARKLLALGAHFRKSMDDPSPCEIVFHAAYYGDPLTMLFLMEHTGMMGDIAAAVIQHRDDALLDWLISKGLDINARDSRGLTPLMYAASHESGIVLRRLIELGAEINAFGFQGETALSLGATDIDKTRTLLDAGADPNVGYGSTALMAAVDAEELQTAKLLIDAGADINYADADGNSALRIAVANDNHEMIELLETHGATVPPIAFEQLHAAILWRKQEDAIRLIVNGADVNAPSSKGFTPLQLAIEHGSDVDLVRCLVEHGADISKTSPDWLNYSPLASAIAAKRYDVALCLLECGADPNDFDGQNVPICIAGYWAHEHPEALQFVKQLLDHGANPNVLDGGEGLSPLVEAARENDLPLIEMLLDNGAEVDMRSGADHNLCSRTALMEAVGNLSIEAAGLLLDRGADVNAADDVGGTALERLCSRASWFPNLAPSETAGTSYDPNQRPETIRTVTEGCRMLLARGAAVNPRSNYGSTPLLAATNWNLHLQLPDGERSPEETAASEELVRLLLTSGADPNVQDEFGRTPLRNAEQCGRVSIARILREAGAVK